MNQSKLVLRVSRGLFPNDPDGTFPIGGMKDVWSISDQGQQTVAGSIQANASIGQNTAAEFLRISYRGNAVMDFHPNGGQVKLRLRYKNIGNTVLPGTEPTWFTIKNPNGENVLQLYEEGRLYHSGNLIETPHLGTRGFQIKSVNSNDINAPQQHVNKDFKLYGEQAFRKITLAPKGLKFHSRTDFIEYENPGIFTKWVNAAPFLGGKVIYDAVFEKLSFNKGADGTDLGRNVHVPLTTRADRLPLMGRLYLPEGNGPFPLVGFIHGGAFSNSDSAEGLDYLAAGCASWGYAAVVISADYLIQAFAEYSISPQSADPNDPSHNSPPSRAILFLELLKLLKALGSKTNFLSGKINFERTMLAGMSLGGHAVTLAKFYNSLNKVFIGKGTPSVALDGSAPFHLGPYNFGIMSQFEMAAQNDYIPPDQDNPAREVRPALHTNILTMFGSRDEEVDKFLSYRNFAVANPQKFKAMVWIFEGNHGSFSTSVSNTGSAGTGRLEPRDQRVVAMFTCLVMADLTISGNDTHAYILQKNPQTYFAEKFFYAPIKLITQYREPREELFLDLNEKTNRLRLGAAWLGELTHSSESAMNYFNPVLFVPDESSKSPFFEAFGDMGVRAIEIAWTHRQSKLEMKFSTPLSLNDWRYFFFHAAQAPVTSHNGHALNVLGQDQDFTVVLKGNQDTVTFAVSEFYSIIWPDTDLGTGHGRNYEVIVPQTIRIPMEDLRAKGWRSTWLHSIHFMFDKRDSGLVYLSDVGYGY